MTIDEGSLDEMEDHVVKYEISIVTDLSSVSVE